MTKGEPGGIDCRVVVDVAILHRVFLWRRRAHDRLPDALHNLTPQREIALIRSGNVAGAIALTGALLGFVVPLASVIAHSARILDLILWGVVALLIQLAGFVVARAIFPGLPNAIVEGQISEAVFLAGLSVALGIIDAACMVG